MPAETVEVEVEVEVEGTSGGGETERERARHTSSVQLPLTPQSVADAPGARCAKRSLGAAFQVDALELISSICTKASAEEGQTHRRHGVRGVRE
jgi:hypothetical protein